MFVCKGQTILLKKHRIVSSQTKTQLQEDRKMFKAYGEFWKRYAKFSGTTDKKSFWLAMLLNAIIGIPLMILAFAGKESAAKMIPFMLYFYATIVPFLAICRRRLRDAGLKGSNLWFILLPYVGWVILIVKFCKPTAPEGMSSADAEDSRAVPAVPGTKAKTAALWKTGSDESLQIEDNVTLMSTSTYRVPGQKRSYSSNIFGILISIGLILGGASGNFVLRGTESSGALVLVGFAFLVFDIIKLINTKKEYEKADMEDAHKRTMLRRAISEAEGCSEQLPEQVTVHLLYDDSVPALDYGATLNGYAMQKETGSETRYSTTSSKRNVLSFNCLTLTAVLDFDDLPGNDVYIRLFKKGTDIGIALPSCVSLVSDSV